jgi:protocatechuate 3,4-dioxygenase alpha subunit
MDNGDVALAADASAAPRGITPSQTAGPYLSLGMEPHCAGHGIPSGIQGAITVRGRVLDGEGVPVPDALVETWQADPDGRFDHPDDPRGAVRRHPAFCLLGRCPTGPDGRWSITTLRPGPVPGPDATTQAPHLDVSVFARGLLHRVVTRIYLPEEAGLVGAGGHARDPVLSTLPPARRNTLIARATAAGYQFDIRLQGQDETVFFDV